MGLRVNTNVASINAQRNLANITGRLQGNFRRLSTGLRISVAADDSLYRCTGGPQGRVCLLAKAHLSVSFPVALRRLVGLWHDANARLMAVKTAARTFRLFVHVQPRLGFEKRMGTVSRYSEQQAIGACAG